MPAAKSHDAECALVRQSSRDSVVQTNAGTLYLAQRRLREVLSAEEFALIASAFALSPREAEYLDHAVADSRDGEIAARMAVSVHTAHSHRRRLFQRLGACDMPGALSVVLVRSLDLRANAAASTQGFAPRPSERRMLDGVYTSGTAQSPIGEYPMDE